MGSARLTTQRWADRLRFSHRADGSVLKVEMSILDKQSKGIAIDE